MTDNTSQEAQVVMVLLLLTSFAFLIVYFWRKKRDDGATEKIASMTDDETTEYTGWSTSAPVSTLEPEPEPLEFETDVPTRSLRVGIANIPGRPSSIGGFSKQYSLKVGIGNQEPQIVETGGDTEFTNVGPDDKLTVEEDDGGLVSSPFGEMGIIVYDVSGNSNPVRSQLVPKMITSNGPVSFNKTFTKSLSDLDDAVTRVTLLVYRGRVPNGPGMYL